MTATKTVLQQAIKDYERHLSAYESTKKTHTKFLKEAEENIAYIKKGIIELKHTFAKLFPETKENETF